MLLYLRRELYYGCSELNRIVMPVHLMLMETAALGFSALNWLWLCLHSYPETLTTER